MKYLIDFEIRLALVIIFFVSLITSALCQNNSLCGPQSLLVICQKNGIHTTLEEICTLSDYDPNDGTSLHGLYNAAKEKGLPADPVKININQLCSLKSPIIAFVDNNHFLVVHECQGGTITIQNPPEKPYSILQETFKKRWNGEAIIFSKILEKQMAPDIAKVFAPPKGAHIFFPKINHNFGTVHEGEILSHTFTFSNTGTDTLIVNTRSSCGCTSALLSDAKVLPGSSGKVVVSYNTKGRIGTKKESVFVRTNAQQNEMVRLTVSATVISSVKVIPEKLRIDGFTHGEVVTRELKVIDSGNNTLKVEKVSAPQGVTAKIKEPRYENNMRIVPIHLTITLNDKPGSFEKSITIHTNDVNRQELQVPIAGEVVSDIRAFPPILFFGEVKPDTSVTIETSISPTREKIIIIRKVTSHSPNITTEVRLSADGTKYILRTTLQTPSIETTLRENLSIYVDGQEDSALDLPLYAKVVVSKK